METILIVDDIDANRRLLRQTLGVFRDFHIIEASNGIEAIEKFSQTHPDLILMDINMPEMDGRESTAKIKAQMGDNYTPIIFVTALTAESSLADALSDGGDDFISKPFDIRTLESKINAHLRIRELNKKLSEKNKQLSHEQNLIEHFFKSAFEKSYLDDKFIRYHMSSMETFNGDVLLAERGPQGGIYIILGDFTGHGLTAAMGTLPVAMTFFKLAGKGSTVEAIARELNFQLHKLMPAGMFMCAALLHIDNAGEKMTLWMGGMPECYWFNDQGQLKESITAQHLSLGILDDSEFTASTKVFDVNKNDKIYIYTDGIVEANNSDDEMFGQARLKEILVENSDNRFDQVLHELKLFTGDGKPNDDITFLELTCNRVPGPNDENMLSE